MNDILDRLTELRSHYNKGMDLLDFLEFNSERYQEWEHEVYRDLHSADRFYFRNPPLISDAYEPIHWDEPSTLYYQLEWLRKAVSFHFEELDKQKIINDNIEI